MNWEKVADALDAVHKEIDDLPVNRLTRESAMLAAIASTLCDALRAGMEEIPDCAQPVEIPWVMWSGRIHSPIPYNKMVEVQYANGSTAIGHSSNFDWNRCHCMITRRLTPKSISFYRILP